MKYHDELKVNHWRMLNPISNLLIKLPLLLVLLTFVEAQGIHPSLNDTQLQNMRLLNLDLLEKHKQIKKSNDLFSEVRDGRSHRVNEKAGMTAIELNEEYQRTLFRTKQVKNERIYSSQQAVYLIDTAIVITLSDTIQHTYERNSKGWVLVDLAVHGKGKQRTNIYRNSYTYDSTGNILRRLTEQWIPNEWRNYSRQSAEYDMNGNVLLDVYEQWMNSQWVIDTRLTYDWDAKGNMLLRVTEYGTDSGVVYDNKIYNVFNPQGHLIYEQREVWENNSWVNDYRVSVAFDENGNMIYWLMEDWAIDHWINNLQGYQEFSPSGKMLVERYEIWKNSIWVNWELATYTYDSIGNPTSYLVQIWSDSSWSNIAFQTMLFTVKGNLIRRLQQIWMNNQWLNETQEKYIYDENGNVTLGEQQWWQNSQWKYRNDVFWIPLDNNGLVVGYSGIIFRGVYKDYFIDLNINEDEFTPKEFTLLQNYPNPFNLSTKIEYSIPAHLPGFKNLEGVAVTLKIYDILGTEISTLVNEQQQPGNYSVQFNAAWLPSGVYFYRLQGGEYFSSKRMLLLK